MAHASLLPLQQTGGRSFCVQIGPHRADIYQWNAPLKPSNYRVVLWLSNGIHGSKIVDGAKSFDEAHQYASDRVRAADARSSEQQILNHQATENALRYGRMLGGLMDSAFPQLNPSRQER